MCGCNPDNGRYVGHWLGTLGSTQNTKNSEEGILFIITVNIYMIRNTYMHGENFGIVIFYIKNPWKGDG